MSDATILEVKDVSKTFKLPHEKNNSIKSLAINIFNRKKSFETQTALKNISFEVKKGEFFGIVGKNGSGKSTLLKIIANIYSPSKGIVVAKGKITPFIELGVGFNMELTGRENIFLNGALLGFSRKEMNAMYDDIVSFAELERFMDQKLKNYSSGMQVRLAFSIAIRAKSDIVVMDEVLAVGDASFQQKCYDVFADLKKQGTTIILVTHDMSAVLRFCDRAIIIDDNKILYEGAPKDVADKYLELNYEAPIGMQETKDITAVKDVKVLVKGKEQKVINPDSDAVIRMDFVNPKKQPLNFGLQIFNESGTYCFGTNTKIQGLRSIKNPSGSIDLEIRLNLVPGRYNITSATMNEDGTKVLSYRPNSQFFQISNQNQIEGVANLSHKWSQDV